MQYQMIQNEKLKSSTCNNDTKNIILIFFSCFVVIVTILVEYGVFTVAPKIGTTLFVISVVLGK